MAEEMRKLEEKAVEQGVSVAELMENAGKQVFSVVKEKYGLDNKHIIIFTGSGNNAGDGFVAARYLSEFCSVLILFFGDEEKFSSETKDNYDKIKEEIAIVKINDKKELENFKVQTNLDLILVDALLGTGVTGEIREPVATAVDYFNSLPGDKVAVDLPSGMDPDTGEVADKTCSVDLVVCFHELKKGLEKIKEKVVVVKIGV